MAENFNADLLIRLIQSTAGRPAASTMAGLAAINGDVIRRDAGVQGDGERLAFGFANGEQALAVLLLKFPVIEADGAAGRRRAGNAASRLRR